MKNFNVIVIDFQHLSKMCTAKLQCMLDLKYE